MLFLKPFYSHEVPETLEFLLIYLTYFRPGWDLIAALGFLWLRWLFLLRNTGSRAWAQ